MFIAQSRDINGWQIFPGCQEEQTKTQMVWLLQLPRSECLPHLPSLRHLPQAFYRWKRHIENLKDHSHQPNHLRQPGYSVELVKTVLRLREEYPGWSKEKLTVLLHREGFACSASTVGRILHKLKERGVLKEPVPNHISARKKQWQRPCAVRKPEQYVAKEPGNIVEKWIHWMSGLCQVWCSSIPPPGTSFLDETFWKPTPEQLLTPLPALLILY